MATKEPGSRKPRRKKSEPASPPPAPSTSDSFARTTVPPQLGDPDKRAKWALPPVGSVDQVGPYIVELNVEHIGGLPGAAVAFLDLYDKFVRSEDANKEATPGQKAPVPNRRREPLRLTKSYYRCDFTDRDWHSIVAADEANPRRQRAIYRLWPDFPIEVHTDRSISTIKADAALRSFDAAGENIVWAVIDSGIQADHPHFGSADSDEARAAHSLLAKDVVGLHRCFADIVEVEEGIDITKVLPDPDLAPDMPPDARDALLAQHQAWALRDDYGHGTHVSGIIAGQAPGDSNRVCAFERQYKVGSDGSEAPSFAPRRIINKEGPNGMPALHGVAPHCKLISLRVLDREGKGRTSQVIQALEYIRDKINDNPKLMRVHGVNLSVGYEFDAEMFACGQSPLCNAVDRLVQEGVVVVAAAGNTGFGTVAASAGASKVGLSNTINDPGNAALAITVGATHRDAPHTYGISYFSSKGPTADGRLKPDLVAPGERITSCAAGKKLEDARKSSDGAADGKDAFYVDDSGTSMAAPHVSGAIAAFLSIRREFIGKPLEVKRIFLDSATSLGRERYFEGRGMVDLMRAIQLV
jgi:subtilisin family serine protease